VVQVLLIRSLSKDIGRPVDRGIVENPRAAKFAYRLSALLADRWKPRNSPGYLVPVVGENVREAFESPCKFRKAVKNSLSGA
jgi:hypothetical protein